MGSKFVAIDTSDIDTLENKLDTEIPVEQFEQIGNLTQSIFSEEDINHIFETYFPVIKDAIQTTDFRNENQDNGKSYILTLDGNRIKEIEIKIFEKFKEDEQTINKINEFLQSQNNSTQINVDDIEKAIENIQETEADSETKIEIAVYQQKQRTTKLEIKVNDTIDIAIEKIITGNSQQYNISYQVNDENEAVAKIYLNANYSGLQSLQSISENYELGMEYQDGEDSILAKTQTAQDEMLIEREDEEVRLLVQSTKLYRASNNIDGDMKAEQFKEEELEDIGAKIEQNDDGTINIIIEETNHKFVLDKDGKIISSPETSSESTDESTKNVITYKYTYNNNVNFQDSVEIEEFSDDNSAILNKYQSESVQNFLQMVSEKITQVNKEQMEKLGTPNGINPIMYVIPLYGNIYSNAMTNINEDLNQAEISAFNNNFLKYEGTNIGGATIRGLLSTIALYSGIQEGDDSAIYADDAQSSTSSYKISEINFNGEEYDVNEQNIASLKEETETESFYRVEFEYDERTGAIYRVVINKK